ncbi:MAG: toxin-antitoxin system YwqK family antitoxin [Planctomycetes bacterium]|nr:toxin-antitoxin system YwqK family antitoxin [Planctomycetota bacterium]
MLTPSKTFLALIAGLALALPIEAEEPAGNAEERTSQEIVVPKNAKPGDIPVQTTENESIRRLVNQVLADRAEASRARVTLRSSFSNHPAHFGVNAYPYAVVPLNEQDQPDGLELFFSVGHGELFRTLPWQAGKRHGEERILEGKRVRTVIPWAEGEIHGVRKTFYPDGTVQLEATYEHGLAQGPTRSYDVRGRLASEIMMKEGKRNGLFREFWPESGKVKREIPYEMGSVSGMARDYYASGQIKREVRFKNNEMHGVDVQYEADGKVGRKKFWRTGQEVSEEKFLGK